jgi:glycosyltransferase involved in cell wall biosynthesis
MRIAQVAPLFESVPPQLYGGTERVVAWLSDSLVRRGHAVTIFATADSQTSAGLVGCVPRGLRLDERRSDPFFAHIAQLGAVADRLDEFDIVHCHVDYPAFLLGRLTRTPFVHTLHGRLDLEGLDRTFAAFPRAPLVSISDSQRLPLASVDLNWRATVYHGLPVDDIPFTPSGGDGGYLAFLGRLSRDKGVIAAIDVAHEVGIPLRIAAKTDPVDRDYYERELRPRIDGTFIQYVGEIGDDEKWKFLGEAMCLLFPIDWPEPFGLVTIEALACGTPVVARPCGAVPEIVRDGETGWLGETVAELAAGVRRVEAIDRVRCRDVVTERFSVAAMTDGYERVYAGLV